MSDLNFSKNNVPLLLGKAGQITVNTGPIPVDKPVPESPSPLFSANFNAGVDKDLLLGADDSVKVAVSTTESFKLTPIFASTPSSKLLCDNGLGDFFQGAANQDKFVLALDVAAAASADVSGSFCYSALTATAEVDTGVDGGYTYLRAFPKTTPLTEVLASFLRSMRLPEQGTTAPAPGEAIALRYGGYLNLSADASVGYKLGGTKAISLAEIGLSEKYELSILGKIGVKAGIAGHFSIVVTADDARPGWTRVRVTRNRSQDISVAADVTVGFDNDLHGLPDNADDFLGAVLGVNAKSFLNVFEKAVEASDYDKLKAGTDGLAQQFISEYAGKSFNGLSPQFADFLSVAKQVQASYITLGDCSVTLFDKFFDKQDMLSGFAKTCLSLDPASLASLRTGITPDEWAVLSQLTDGDPLTCLLGETTIAGNKIDTLKKLKDRAQSVQNLINNEEGRHDALRKVVALARQDFAPASFFQALAKVKTVDDLKGLASDKVGFFVCRLVGSQLDSVPHLKTALDKVHAVLNNVDSFKDNLYSSLCAVACSSWKLALNSEYSVAVDNDALVDVSINLANPKGPALLTQAGKGDFSDLLSTTDPDVVRLREGVLTHHTQRDGSFRVNITGWHLNYQYEGFDKVITEAKQRLTPGPHGLMIDSTVTLQTERERKRRDESMHVNFLLRAVGESANVVKSSPKNLDYLIDTLTALTASYQLAFTDNDTSAQELGDYLAFARDLELDKQGATLKQLSPFLPRAANGGFGKVDTSYDVRFGERAVQALLSVKALTTDHESTIRNTMRLNLLANYLKSDALHNVAFAYATPGVFAVYNAEGPSSFANNSSRTFNIALSAAINAPARVTLTQTELQVLETLYGIENSMIAAIVDLIKVLNSNQAIDPDKFQNKLGKFGSAMNDYDEFDQTTNKSGIGANSVFVLFDTLVRLASGTTPANIGLLHLCSTVCGKQVEKIFLSEGAIAADRAEASRRLDSGK